MKFSNTKNLRDFFKIKPTIFVFLILFFCVFSFFDGNLGRYDKSVVIAGDEARNVNRYRDECFVSKGDKFKSCKFGDSVSVILIGDSHSDAIVTYLLDTLPKNKGLLYFGYSGCPTLLNANRIKQKQNESLFCERFNLWAFDQISKYNSDIPLIIVNRITHYAFGFQSHETEYRSPPHTPVITFGDDTESIPLSVTDEFLVDFDINLKETLNYLTNQRDVFFTLPIPEMLVDVPTAQVINIIEGKDNVSIDLSDYLDRNYHVLNLLKEISEENNKLHLLNPQDYFCDKVTCFGSDVYGRPYYFDDDHLSEYGNKLLSLMFKSVNHYLP
ncbi:hypothetical protein L8R80_17575 [Vibrio splendidus]|uniref:SGNH hydrolase domain-containing protein n=1 Tax=Vibrio splendidus TaxID=29497 RepID=UPI0024691103|nr:SGNH hydrolase domain-containing protein [Vibrio splendidus]MDH5943296.1 hypothetical protein [Vibrio splendidus]MDH5987930.1 hypothetical protein [Vibrio splendidus]MDH5995045.1 hypothetical protein [Vibrio splendidus]MDH6007911.1 hypothetical protein [Vibrio splendidus]